MYWYDLIWIRIDTNSYILIYFPPPALDTVFIWNYYVCNNIITLESMQFILEVYCYLYYFASILVIDALEMTILCWTTFKNIFDIQITNNINSNKPVEIHQTNIKLWSVKLQHRARCKLRQHTPKRCNPCSLCVETHISDSKSLPRSSLASPINYKCNQK